MNLPTEVQGSSASTLVSLWAENDPKAAAEWAMKFPDGETRNDVIPAIASTWAATEPEKAVIWTLGLTDSPEQREAMDDAVGTWTSVAPAALQSWVEQQPPNEATDHLRTVAAATLVESHPEDALAMASKISDQDKRQSSLTRLLRSWGRVDPAAAKTWAEKEGLPAGVPKRLKNNAQ